MNPVYKTCEQLTKEGIQYSSPLNIAHLEKRTDDLFILTLKPRFMYFDMFPKFYGKGISIDGSGFRTFNTYNYLAIAIFIIAQTIFFVTIPKIEPFYLWYLIAETSVIIGLKWHVYFEIKKMVNNILQEEKMEPS